MFLRAKTFIKNENGKPSADAAATTAAAFTAAAIVLLLLPRYGPVRSWAVNVNKGYFHLL